MSLFNRRNLKRSLNLPTLLALVLCPPAFSQDAITWKEDVKGWGISVDTTIGYGCFMLAAFEGGTLLRAQFNPEKDVFQFIVANSDWQSLERGKLYDINVKFGTLVPWTGMASVHYFGNDLPALSFDVSFEDGKAELFIEEFMRTTGVRVFYDGNQIVNVSLRGTFAAMQEVFSCQSAMMERENENKTDPFSNSPESKSDPFD